MVAFVEWEKFLKELKEVWNNSQEANRLREDYLGMIRCCCACFQSPPSNNTKSFFAVASDPGQHPSLTPDDDVFRHLATIYAQNHPTMHKGAVCRDSSFPGGIVNGAAWYSFSGIKNTPLFIAFIIKLLTPRWNV